MNTSFRIIFLLSIANLVFGMDTAAPESPKAADFPSTSATVLPKATVYFKVRDGYKALKDSQTLSDEPKIFSNAEKNGCCRLWHEDEKWFVQKEDSIRHIPIGKAQQIQKPNDTELSLLLRHDSLLKTIIQIGNENYLLRSDKVGQKLRIIPYEKINTIANFFVAQKKGQENQKLLQILPNDLINSQYEQPTINFTGNIIGYIDGRLLIDIVSGPKKQ